MTILAALPALIFGLAGLTAVMVLAVSGRRFIGAWADVRRALETCSEVRVARVTIVSLRPQLRLVEGGLRLPVAASDRGLREAA